MTFQQFGPWRCLDGTVEPVAGGVEGIGLAAQLANSIDRSNQLHKTYAPVDIEAMWGVDEARIAGRRKMRRGNKPEAKVSTEHTTEVSTVIRKQLSSYVRGQEVMTSRATSDSLPTHLQGTSVDKFVGACTGQEMKR